jgi:hypothetical protein
MKPLKLFRVQISQMRRSLVKSIQKSVAASGLEFYPSGYTDATESDNRLKLAKLPKPIRLKLPVTTDDDLITIEYFTKSGFVSDSYAGGICIEDWRCVPIENLLKFSKILTRRFP